MRILKTNKNLNTLNKKKQNTNMIKIMFVCHGNICRSPMAEFIFKKLISERGVASEFSVASSATSCEELGNPVYPPAAAMLRRIGIDPRGKRAVRLQSSDYDKYDLFIGMDGANVKNMHRIFSSDPKSKIALLLDYVGERRDVADPWYSGNFEQAYFDIHRGCIALLDALCAKSGFSLKNVDRS